ncbi:hypothetical protein QBC47DRAFT_393605 [Echria macrotheca]|uniref:Rhodopsin domain-containing protein n=1 Tax=Echria macrotheca TaxID=438768 RepID=A0AAJ0F0V0_9PEZI|nr:hypothetical protein QBC47DRAFT_393605 [Echria macrotheca]
MAPLGFDDIPAMQPPAGQVSNFVDPPSLHPIVFGVGLSTMILMVTALGIRIFTKAVLMKAVRAEEYFAIVGTIGIITWDSIFIGVSADGFSRHLWDVRITSVPHLSYLSYLAEITNAPTMFLAKCSILFQLRRLFCPDGTRNSTFWAIHGLVFVCAAYYTSAIFTFVFQCMPREKTWNPLLEGHCINVSAAIVVQGAVNLVLDVGILIVPFWAVWRLRLPMKRKLGISAVFGVGILTCIIAGIGVAFRLPLIYDKDPDLTYLITKVGIWTMVEYCGTIVVGCMMSFPRFFLYLRGREPTSAASGPRSRQSNPVRPGTKQSGAAPTNNIHHDDHPKKTSVENDDVGSIGLALSTSESSSDDHGHPPSIEMEDSTSWQRRRERESHPDTLMEEGTCGVDSDWSPLSTPTK